MNDTPTEWDTLPVTIAVPKPDALPRIGEALDLLHKRGHVTATKTGKRGADYRPAEFVDSSSSSEEEWA